MRLRCPLQLPITFTIPTSRFFYPFSTLFLPLRFRWQKE
jgi:hypothetical protein